MKQVLLSIEDDAYEKVMGMLSLCPSVKVESVDDYIVTEEKEISVPRLHSTRSLKTM